MFRRMVAILVALGLLASHLAAIPHAHGGMSAAEQKRHDATPHFHSHGPGHAHHGRRHDHRHSPKSHKTHLPQLPAEVAGEGALSPVTVESHDSSTVFVPVSATSSAQKVASVTADTGTWTSAPCELLAASQVKWASAPWHPPDEVLDGSKLYLTLRTLRN